jgi:hypothetical protein
MVRAHQHHGGGERPIHTRKVMKSIKVITAGIGFVVFAFFAAAGPAPQDVAIAGKARCTKCGAKETPFCQTVVLVEAGREKAVYSLVENDVTTALHDKLGTATKGVRVKGPVQRNGARLKLTPKSFEMIE